DFWWKNGTEMFKAFQETPVVVESEIAGGGCLIYRRSAVQMAGGFPDDLTVVSFREDSDLSHRVHLLGYKVLVDTRAIALHMSASRGGCRDTAEWERHFATDGLLFLEKLEIWREEQRQLSELKKSHGPIKLLLLYDEVGWAWWHRSQHIKRNISANVEVHIGKLGEYFDHSPFDFVFAFDHDILRELPFVPQDKLIVGNSCPKLIQGALDVLQSGRCAAVIVNNYETFKRYRHLPGVFCCQNGVDLDLFFPAQEPVKELVACWTGHSQSIGNKGLDLLREACRREKVDLLVVDAAKKAKNERANTQEWVRDNLYRQASVYICASEFEGTPNPALEALATGVPVITTSVGNMPELIVDGHNGFIVERSVEAIANALRKLKALDRKTIAANARRSVEIGWSWRAQTKKYERVLQSLLRERVYGRSKKPSVDPREVDRAVAERMSAANHPTNIDSYVRERNGKIAILDSSIVDDLLTKEGMLRLAEALLSFGPFQFHFGGVGDALLLMSTFGDRAADQRIFSISTSPAATRAFFEEFPNLGEVYIAPFPKRAESAMVARAIIRRVPGFLGAGVTPIGAHDDEWNDSLDIFVRYGVQRSPLWAREFIKPSKSGLHAVIAPKGSERDMSTGKRNVIDPALWQPLLDLLVSEGWEVSVIGVPEERAMYPSKAGVDDRRSYRFGEQMSLVASCDLLISADSWAKTFRGLLDAPAVVFPPLYGTEHRLGSDASANVFIRPWPSLHVVTSIEDVRLAIEGFAPSDSPEPTALAVERHSFHDR
ncbi:MAG: glycosyltransferase, partial [Deltaproteobacteria bacterium]|nr:glycosyltransferase [Deltaproteobacteria bacterium]